MSIQLEAIVIDGQTVWVEVSEITPVKTPGASKFSPTNAGDAAATLEKVDVARTLKAVITPVHEALRTLRPEEVSVELSLGLKGEVGVFVAKSEGSATLKVTAKWKFSGTA